MASSVPRQAILSSFSWSENPRAGHLIKDADDVRVQSRNQKELTRMYPSVATAGRGVKAKHAIVDGEIVAVDASGRPSFQALQHRSLHPNHQILFYAFDLLDLNGQDLTPRPLMKRRGQLSKIIPPDAHLRLLQPLPGTAGEIVQAVRDLGLEGVIAKRKDSPYQPPRQAIEPRDDQRASHAVCLLKRC